MYLASGYLVPAPGGYLWRAYSDCLILIVKSIYIDPAFLSLPCENQSFYPVYFITHISHNDLPEFPSAALASIDDASASYHSFALQAENSFCTIMLKANETVHWFHILNFEFLVINFFCMTFYKSGNQSCEQF